MSDWCFCYEKESNGWWLRIESMEELLAFIKEKGGFVQKGADMLLRIMHLQEGKTKPDSNIFNMIENLTSEQRFNLMREDMTGWNILHGALLSAEKDMTILDALRSLNMQFGMDYADHLKRDGVLFLNPVGGATLPFSYENFCFREKLVWPDFTEKDIRIKQFSGGRHWYAYLGDIEVKQDGIKRFNTHAEAYNAAASLLEHDKL